MRPINLKIKGINSYVSEQKVDFEKLAQSNLFGIFGETGSGKTTILDSIVMALYGTSDRDITQNIINVNTKDAYIVFEFEIVKDGSKKRFEIRRDYKLRPSGLKTEAYLTDLLSKKVVAEGSDEVNEKVLKLIGVGKKEFLKCIALPQGEFDRFLQDTPAMRKRTIAKLFNLEQFGIELTEKLKARKEKTTLHKLSLEEKLSVYRNVTEDKIKDNEELLEKYEAEKINTEFELNKISTKLARLQAEYEKKIKLNEMNLQLSLCRSEKSEIDNLRKQVEFSVKYGNFVVLNTNYKNAYNELISIDEKIGNLKDKIKELEKILVADQESISSNSAEKNNIDINLQNALSTIENQKILLAQIDEKSSKLNEIKLEKQNFENTLKSLALDIASKNAEQEKIVSKITALKQNLEEINKLIEVLDKVSTWGVREENYEMLNELLEYLPKESINEISNEKFYKDLYKLRTKIIGYREICLSELEEFKKYLENNNLDNNNYKQIKEEKFIKRNEILNQISALNNNSLRLNSDIFKIQADITAKQAIVLSKTNEIQEIELDIQEVKNKFVPVPSNSALDAMKKKSQELSASNEKLQIIVNNNISKKQQLIIDLEVEINNNSNVSTQLKEYANLLKSFDLDKYESVLLSDKKYLLNDEEIKSSSEKIKEFDENFAYLTKTQNELTLSLGNSVINKSLLVQFENKKEQSQNALNELNVNIGITKKLISEQKKNIINVKALTEELATTNKELNTILDLQELLTGGALLEYVAEEYMYLITDFANKYVYNISKGKYFLKYNGEFSVIDNFNGGIMRGVKTLSGGEKFIISLSLALGISQSIATNNNKNFNFFFIDEGFGSLSDNYIDKVLQSFDALIKLDFTVGFISHVEKMQNYITNKIIVTKESNEAGSKITEYY